MVVKKKETIKKPIVKKVVKKAPIKKRKVAIKKPTESLPIKWSGAEYQIPKVGDYFKVKWVEGKVIKINSPIAWMNEVELWGGIHHILNKPLRDQLLKSKGYYKKKIKENKWNESTTKWGYLVWEKLTVKQKLFCEHYIKNDDLRGNATMCYNEAFSFKLDEKDRTREKNNKWEEIAWTSEYDKAYNNCSSESSRLSRNLKIQEENRRLLNEMLTNTIVDSRLAKILLGWKDADSLNAVKEYNKMKWRVIDINKNEWASEDAKAEVYKKLAEKVDDMKPDEINTALNDLLNN